MFKTVILIGIGGGLGSIGRYFTSFFVSKYTSLSFPLGTFLVNVLGCFLIGILMGYFVRGNYAGTDLGFLLVIGFCGGYTTFSTFAVENIGLMQSQQFLLAFMYIVLSLVVGLLATWIGLFLMK